MNINSTALFVSVSDCVDPAIEAFSFKQNNPMAMPGISSGFPSLDEFFSGIQRGDLIVVAGRPSMGQQTFVQQIALNIAKDTRQSVAILDSEKNATFHAMRMMTAIAKLDFWSIRRGDVNQSESNALSLAANSLRTLPIYFSTHAPSSVLDIKHQIAHFKKKVGGLGLVVVDCLLDLKRCDESMDSNSAAKVVRISRELKSLAIIENLPIIVLSDVDQKVERRADKCPMIFDLAGGGAIANSADLVLYIYKDYLYHDKAEAREIAEVVVSRNRRGPTGRVKLKYSPQSQIFEEYTPS